MPSWMAGWIRLSRPICSGSHEQEPLQGEIGQAAAGLIAVHEHRGR